MAAFVPPAVANANAQHSLDTAVDIPAGPGNVRVTRSVKRTKIAEGLFVSGAITEAEYGDHVGFQARCTAAATGVVAGGGAPAWFGPALDAWFGPALAAGLAAGLAPINARLDNIDTRLDNIDTRLDNIETRLDNIDANLVNINARQTNAVAVHQNDILVPLINAAGNPFPNFPANLQALNTMNGPALTAIFVFYGLVGTVGLSVESRRDRFKKFVGIRL